VKKSTSSRDPLAEAIVMLTEERDKLDALIVQLEARRRR
jgi:hypothetical protein